MPPVSKAKSASRRTSSVDNRVGVSLCLRVFARCILSILAAAALAATASAAEYVVVPGGNDANPGTKKAPFKTIGRGLFELKAGDTLLVAAAAYKETCLLRVKGSEDRPVVVRGVPDKEGRLPLIQAAGQDGLSIQDSTCVTVEGVNVIGAARAGFLVEGSDRITITGCASGDNGKWAFKTASSDHVSIAKCEAFGSKDGDGVCFSSTDHAVISDSKVRDNAFCGVLLAANAAEGGDGMITGANVARNIITGNGARGGAAIRLEGVEKSTVENNVCDKNLAGGIVACKGSGARAGSRNRFLINVVQFPKGSGSFGVQLLDGSTNASLEQTTVAIESGPAVVVDDASSKGLRATFNFYSDLGKGVTFIYKSQTLDFARWQSQTGQDKDSHVGRSEASAPRPGQTP